MRVSEIVDPVAQLKKELLARRDQLQASRDDEDLTYRVIDEVMRSICTRYRLPPQQLHDAWVKKYGEVPDSWIMKH